MKSPRSIAIPAALWSIVCLLSLAASPVAAADESPTALICRGGDPANSLIIDTAVAELQLHLQRFLGIQSTLVQNLDTPSPNRLQFVVGSPPPDAPAEAVTDGRFAIVIRDGVVWLWGHDRQARGKSNGWDPRNSRKGSLQAVYQFLHQFAGIRWLLPGEDNTVRKNPTDPLVLPSSFQQVYSFQLSLAHMDVYGRPDALGNHLWRSMDRMNLGVTHSFSHNWGPLLGYNEHFQTHPEYYPLINGERKSFPPGNPPKTKGIQVCTSNPAVADFFAQRIIDLYRRTKQEIIEVSPNDGGGFCQCDNCRALDRPDLYSPQEIADLGGPCISDRIFTFINAVARKVKAQEPNARLGMYLYSYYAAPPKSIDRLEDNIIGDFCVEPAYFNDPDYQRLTRQRIGQWMDKGLGGMAFFWYHGSYYWSQALHVSPHAVAQFIREIARTPGMLGVKTEANNDWGPSGLDYYVFFAMLNDPSRDTDQIIDEFCSLAYGPGAAPMKAFFTLAEQTFMARTTPAWKHYASVGRWYDDRFFTQAYDLIHQAMTAAAASKDPHHRQRIAIMLDALDHTRNLCDFVQSAAALRAYGLPFDLPHLDPGYKPPFPVRPADIAMRDALIHRAALSRQRMLAHAARLDGTAFFKAADMLKNDAVGNWGKTLQMLDTLRGHDEVLMLTAAYPFQIDPQDKGETQGWHTPQFQPADWKNLRLDACWEDQGFGDPSPQGYNGSAWYRIPFTAPARYAGSTVSLHLGAVDESCTIWINGEKAGQFLFDPKREPDGWNTPRVVNITRAVRFDAPNLIAVRVHDQSGKGGIWKGAFLTFDAKK